MILQSYILRSLVRPFFIGFGFITFLLTMDMLLDLLDLLLGRGIDLWTVTKLFFLGLGWMIALTVPCGILVATLMTYGRMSQDNEITALRASGVHVLRIVTPTLIVATLMAAGLTAFNNYVLPESNYAFAKLRDRIFRTNPTAQIREGVIIDDFKGYSIRINRLDDRSGAMEDILILDGREDSQSPRTILADHGTLEYLPERRLLRLNLVDGTVHHAEPSSKEGEYRVVAFETQTLNIQDEEDAWKSAPERTRGDREMSIGRMQEEIHKLKEQRVRQQEQVQSALAELELGSVEELARLDPDAVPLQGSDAWTAKLRGMLTGALSGDAPVAEPPDWTPEQEQQVSLVRSRYREGMALARKIEKYRVEVHKKFSIPFACVVFVLVGAPLGMLARRGGMAVGLLSVVFLIFYYLCLIGGEKLADRLLFPTWLAMWLPNIVLGGFGFWLMVRATRTARTAPPQPGRGTSRS